MTTRLAKEAACVLKVFYLLNSMLRSAVEWYTRTPFEDCIMATAVNARNRIMQSKPKGELGAKLTTTAAAALI